MDFLKHSKCLSADSAPSCSDAQFRCGDGECRNLHERCDGVDNCKDKSDEVAAMCDKGKASSDFSA